MPLKCTDVRCTLRSGAICLPLEHISDHFWPCVDIWLSFKKKKKKKFLSLFKVLVQPNISTMPVERYLNKHKWVCVVVCLFFLCLPACLSLCRQSVCRQSYTCRRSLSSDLNSLVCVDVCTVILGSDITLPTSSESRVFTRYSVRPRVLCTLAFLNNVVRTLRHWSSKLWTGVYCGVYEYCA